MSLHYTNYNPADLPAWERLRADFCRRGVGGSAMGRIAGLEGAYGSAYSEWAEIVGLVPPKPSDSPYLQDGRDLEELVARRFEQKSGLKLRHRYAIITNDQYPHLFANVDRFVDLEDAGWEGKTYDPRSDKFDDGCPESYKAQVTVYLAVTGKKKWYLSAWSYGQGTKHYLFTLDPAEKKPDFIDQMIVVDPADFDACEKLAAQFVGYCRSKDTPPPVDGSEATEKVLRAIHPQSLDGTAADLTAYAADLEAIAAFDRQIDELEKNKELHKQRLMEFLGETERGTAPGYTVSYKTSVTRRLDTKKAKEALGAALDPFYQEFSSRALRIRRVKAA